MKKLYKIRKDKKICGVCNGLSEYLDVDVSIIRIIWLVCAFSGVGVLAYFIAALVLPFKEE
jgi:phage shock protein PspC (stress-responsive transcriptional regulator)